MKTEKKIPTFMIVGASRCATHLMSKWLNQHPELYVYPNEFMFFFHPRKGGKSNYEIEGIEGYYKKFKNIDKKFGEVSPGYLLDKTIPALIKKHFPNVKIIVSIRNPIKRYRSEKVYFKNFQYLDMPREWLIDGGMYYEKLLRYYNLFPKKNVKVVLVEDIDKNRVKFAQELYKFIGVNKNFVPENIGRRSNEISKAKYKSLEYYRKGVSKIAEFLKQNNLVFIVNFFRKLKLNRLSWYIWEKNRVRIDRIPELTQKEKKELLKVFEKDIDKTGKLIGRNLSDWKKI